MLEQVADSGSESTGARLETIQNFTDASNFKGCSMDYYTLKMFCVCEQLLESAENESTLCTG